MSDLQFFREPVVRGSNRISINVFRAGEVSSTGHRQHCASLWTYRDTRSTKSPWTAQLLDGRFQHFYAATKAAALRQAQSWVRDQLAA